MPTPRIPMLSLEDSVAAAEAGADPGSAGRAQHLSHAAPTNPKTAKADQRPSVVDAVRRCTRRSGSASSSSCGSDGPPAATTSGPNTGPSPRTPSGAPADEVLAVSATGRTPRSSVTPNSVVLRATDETLATGAVSDETTIVPGPRRCSTQTRRSWSSSPRSAAWRSISQIARSLDIALEDGDASWPPDGVPGPGAIDPA